MKGKWKARILYLDPQGETKWRTVILDCLKWGSTEWYPEPQFIWWAYDLERRAKRGFALDCVLSVEFLEFL